MGKARRGGDCGRYLMNLLNQSGSKCVTGGASPWHVTITFMGKNLKLVDSYMKLASALVNVSSAVDCYRCLQEWFIIGSSINVDRSTVA